MTKNEMPYEPKREPIQETISFNGADFATTFWAVPEGIDIKGRLLFVHGFSEYSKVYTRVFEQFSDAGYEVFFFDQRGAGKTSLGKKKGITDEFHTFNDLNFFIEKNLKELKESEKHKNKKLFLGGHSMGGGISLNYGVNGKHKDELRGIAVTGPLILLHPDSRPGKIFFSIAKFLMKFIPNFRIDTALKSEYVTSDLAWRDFLANDKIVSPLLGSLKQIYDFLVRGQKLLDPSYNKDFSVPVLIAHGEDDKINDPSASEQFIEAIKIDDKTLIKPKAGRHSLFVEEETIYNKTKTDFLEWFDKR